MSTTPNVNNSFVNYLQTHDDDPFDQSNPFADLKSINKNQQSSYLPPLPESPDVHIKKHDPSCLLPHTPIHNTTTTASPLLHRSGLLSPSLRRSSQSVVLVEADPLSAISSIDEHHHVKKSQSVNLVMDAVQDDKYKVPVADVMPHRRGPLGISQTQLLLPCIADSPFHIKVLDPIKVGDGMQTYVSYKIITKTTTAGFKPDSFVARRYSEFLWLAKRFAANHPGVIVPGIPEKQTLGRFQEEFVEHRRVALQCFLRKCGAHPILSKDDLFQKFLELDSIKDEVMHDKPIPLATKSSKFDDPDIWYFEKRLQLDQFEHQVKSMHKSLGQVSNCMRDVASAHHAFGETVLMLAEIEVPHEVGKELEKLGEVHKRMRDILFAMAQLDFGHLELALDDQVRTLASIKSSMQVRSNAYQTWQALDQSMQKKQAVLKKSRFEQPQLQAEIESLNDQVRVSQCNFQTISKTLRSELDRVETDKVNELSIALQAMADTTFAHQQNMVHLWEDFFGRQ